MADYCFELMLTPSPHAIPAEEQDAGKWHKGDIVTVYDADMLGTKQGNRYTPKGNPSMPRTCYLFVTGIPDSHPSVGDIDLNFIRNLLASPDSEVTLNGDNPVFTKLLKRKFNLNVDFNPFLSNDLTNNKYASVSFNQAKGWIFNRKEQRFFDETKDFIP